MKKKDHPSRGEQAHVEATFHGESFSGPLPHPDLLVKYNAAVADAAERILRMAENQAAHRQEIEKQVINNNTLNQTLGTVFALIISLCVIGGGVFLISRGANIIGFVTLISTLGSLVAIFMRARSGQERERRDKQRALPVR